MKKIGILTIHKAINYGSVLQAYGIQKQVADLGFDAEIIDYGSIGVADVASPKTQNSISRKLFKYILHPVSNFKHLVRRIELLVIKRAEDYLFKKDLEIQKGSFRKFETKHLKISKDSYHSNDDLESVNLIYDGVITGSDQVWNPLITENDLAYFLNFITNNNKKVSYAASFGYEDIPEGFLNRIAPELQSIKHLSVREVSGARIIKRITGLDAQVVLDPALLLSGEEWGEIIPESKIGEPYIFSYAFMNSPEIERLCKHLSKVTGFKIVRLSLYHRGFQRIKEHLDRSTTYVNHCGPLEFLSYLSNASIVVTNSFHGTVFSLNFRKDFFVIPPEHNIERIVGLLDLCKLSDRLQKQGNALPAKNDIEIDYSKVEPIFVSERSKSIEFLQRSLNDL